MADILEKKAKLAAEDRPPHPRSLEWLGGLVIQSEDELLRDHDELARRVREFRSTLELYFKGTDSDVYANADRSWIQYSLSGLGWHVYHDVNRDVFWGYRDTEDEPACSRDCVSLLLEDIKLIKEKDDDEAYGVHRSSFWGEIAKTVKAKIDPRRRLRYRLKNDTVDEKEDDAIVFTLDGTFTFEANSDGTFSCRGLANSSLDEVLAHLQDPEKQTIRAKIVQVQTVLKQAISDQEDWRAISQAAARLQEVLRKKGNPFWSPDTNIRGFYFGLDTLCTHAKDQTKLPVPSLEQAVVNECLKEMVNLPTPEIVKKLELVSRLVKENEAGV